MAGAADLYRWTDENGKTHYGDSVPEQYKNRARRVQGGSEVSEQERSVAAERLEKEKARAEAAEAARARPAASQPPAASSSTAKAAPSELLSCEEQLRRFKESADCFAKYSLPMGGVRPEAFDNCTEIKQPNC